MSDHSTLARVAGATGIAGQVAAALPFLLIPALVVPTPANYLFYAAWAVLLVLAIAWWQHHPWRSFLVPVISVPLAYFVLALGERVLGWAA